MLSIIVVTVDRTRQTEHFLLSLTHQTCADLEVVLMHAPQMPETTVAAMCARFPSLRIRAFPSPDTCLSRSRNAALAHVAGDCFAIADDDCLYPPEVVARVLETFRRHAELAVLMGSPVSLDPGDIPTGDAPVPLPAWRLFTGCPSFVHFYRTAVCDAVGGFDECLGVGCGTPYQSGEETDFALRAVRAGFAAARVPSLVILHPSTTPGGAAMRRKIRTYARGRMQLLRKHGCPAGFIALNVLYPLLALPVEWLAAARRLARYRLCMFIERFLSLWRD
ncbi:glycosyltransferase family 2 protein [uncultured Desulfovibrio sp.]|uniref:glycosyltransferase family 2 protein n=1 Tax=uncultured Desulfovibrio sp. TaxID=167968 RepID=UPI0025F99944|nr:glycosyltransferase family A protein [uncultured Desulfovibrio sp.]